MPNVKLTRQTLSQFLPNHEAIRAFEQMLDAFSKMSPSSVEEANNNAAIAIAAANSALSAFTELANQVSMLVSGPEYSDTEQPNDVAPRQQSTIIEELTARISQLEAVIGESMADLAPRLQVGTIAAQNADAAEILGGSIDGTTIGANATAPGKFTTLEAIGFVTLSPANLNVTISPTGTGTVTIAPATEGNINNMAIGATTRAAGNFTSLDYNGTLTGGNAAITIGTNHIVKDTSGNIGFGTATPTAYAGYRVLEGKGSSGGAGGLFKSTSSDSVVSAEYYSLSAGGSSAVFFGSVTGHDVVITANGLEKIRAISGGGAKVTGALQVTTTLTTLGGATFHTTSSALTNGAGVAAGTISNAPAAGNPTKWIGINDNGTTRYIPAW